MRTWVSQHVFTRQIIPDEFGGLLWGCYSSGRQRKSNKSNLPKQYKSFDSVLCVNLVSNLERHGLDRRTTQWIKTSAEWSYLKTSGQWLDIQLVIPQGPVLEPALFNIFVATWTMEFSAPSASLLMTQSCLGTSTPRAGLPSRRMLTGLRDGPVWPSESSKRPSARCCTSISEIPRTSTGWAENG